VSTGRAAPEKRAHAALILFAVALGMGPTVGDIGSCAQEVDALDAPTFFAMKARLDCARCSECSLTGKECEAACTGSRRASFVPGCAPLVHDGEVCLHALIHASCDDYASYVDEARPTAPSECQFCPLP
jgi:hypothetical protein